MCLSAGGLATWRFGKRKLGCPPCNVLECHTSLNGQLGGENVVHLSHYSGPGAPVGLNVGTTEGAARPR